MHGILDHPHLVVVDFPTDFVSVVDFWNEPLERRLGIVRKPGRVVMGVGCGGHTHYEATLVREDKMGLANFRSALLNGKVVACQW